MCDKCMHAWHAHQYISLLGTKVRAPPAQAPFDTHAQCPMQKTSLSQAFSGM